MKINFYEDDMSISLMFCNKDITLDDKHVYKYGNELYEDSITSIISGRKNSNYESPLMQTAGNYGTTVHSIVESKLKGCKQQPYDVSSLEHRSAEIILGWLYTMIDEYMPRNKLRNPKSKLVRNIGSEVRMIGTWRMESYPQCFFGGTADAVVDISTRTGKGNRYRMVFEFKTTKASNSKDHMIQIATYMKLLGADFGAVIYDNPSVHPRIINDFEHLDDLVCCFEGKCKKYFLEPVVCKHQLVEKIGECQRLMDEDEKITERARQRRLEILEKILEEDSWVREKFELGFPVVLGDVILEKKVSKRVSLNDHFLFRQKYPRVYKEFVDEEIVESKVFKKK